MLPRLTRRVPSLVVVAFILLLSAQSTWAPTLGSVDGSAPAVSNTTASSTGWAGYVAASGKNPGPVVTAIYGSWVVQAVAPSTRPTFSSQWVGIGGYFTGDLTLIQAGSESYSSGGTTNYLAWWQALPGGTNTISRPVGAGDVIQVSVVCIDLCTSTTQGWKISVSDHTLGWKFSVTLSYPSKEKSGEWIEERPAACTRSNCPLTTLADFGTSTYGKDYTRVTQSCSATIGGATLPIGSLPYTQISMFESSSGPLIAQPSPISADGTSFTVKFFG